MDFSDLPITDQTIPGYTRLHAYPRNWPTWKEPDGRCYALVIGGPRPFSPETELFKEEIPQSVHESICG